MKRSRKLFRKLGSNRISKFDLSKSSTIALEPLEERRLLTVPGSVLFQITAPDTTSDWPTYLKTLNWEDQSQQDMLSDTDLDTAEALIDISAGTGQRDFLVIVDVPLAVDTVQLADDLEALTHVNWAFENRGQSGANPNWQSIDLTGLDLNESDPFLQTQPNDDRYLDSSNDPQWFYDALDLETAWQVTRGAGVLIAEGAGGVNIAHEDLRRSLQNPDEVADGTDTDGNGYIDDVHGVDLFTGLDANLYIVDPTDPAHDNAALGIGLAGFNNEVGVAGVAGEAKGIRVISSRLGGPSTEESVLAARYYVEEGVGIAFAPKNGQFGPENAGPTDALDDMVTDYYVENDVLLFGILGNNASETENNFNFGVQGDDRSLIVTGTTLQGTTETRWGAFGPSIDLLTPASGLDLVGQASVDGLSSGYYTNSGLSFGRPLVMAVAALVRSANPGWSAEEVATALLATADDVFVSGVFTNPLNQGVLGAGRVNAGAAVTGPIPAPQIEKLAVPDPDQNGEQYLPIDEFGVYSGYVFDKETVENSSNWMLYGAGVNGIFEAGGGDDVNIDITLETDYGIGSRWLAFSVDNPASMTDGTYEFRAVSGAGGLRDALGEQLDGNGDGTAGDDFVAQFEYSGASYVPASPIVTLNSSSDVLVGETQPIEVTIPDLFPGTSGVFVSQSSLTPGLVARYQDYTIEIDATNDGIFEQSLTVQVDYTVSNPDLTFSVGIEETPHYADTFTANVQITGKYGIQTSNTVAYSLEYFRTENVNGQVDLVVSGTGGNDDLSLTGSAGDYNLVIKDADTQTVLVDESNLPSITGRVIANGLEGNDLLDFSLATGVSVVANGDEGNDTISGGNLADSISGGSGDDSIAGLDGSDEIDGGMGDDTISGGSLADSLDGGSGNDSILGLDGDDTILGGEGDDILSGGADTDSLDGGLGDDSIGGGGGNDNIQGGDGNDFLSGDAGDDTLDSGAGSDLVLGRDGNDELLSSQGSPSNVFVGGDGQDSINLNDFFHVGMVISDDIALSDQDLESVWAEWKSSRTFAERVANLSGTGVGPRENGNVFLIPGTTVVRDDDIDDLTVGFGSVWVQSDFEHDQVTGASFFGVASSIALVELHATNLREATVTGPSTAVRGEPVVFSFSAGIKPDNNEDDSYWDPFQELNPPAVGDYFFDINWGDGASETVVGGDNVEVTHIFESANASIDVEVTVRSSTMATDLVTTHNIEVKTHEKRLVGGETVLIVGGTSADEQFLITDDALDVNGTVNVRITDEGTQQETYYSDSGFAGRVIIYAQGGADAILGNLLNHRGVEAHGQGGIGIFIGSDQDDQFYGGDDSDTMFGRAGNDLIVGNGSADYIVGEGDDDTLNGGLGDDAYVFERPTLSDLGTDTVIDGTGVDDDAFDTALFVGFGESITVDISAVTMVNMTGKLVLQYDTSLGTERVFEAVAGTPFPDSIIGNDKNNFLAGVDGDDTLQGGDGDDFLSGDLGDDLLQGGAGNDTYLFERELGTEDLGEDKILEGVGAQDDEFDILNLQGFGEGIVLDLSSSTLVNMANKLVLKLDDSHVTANEDELIEGVRGSEFDDSITGDAAQNFLGGEGGDDTIDGGAGDDNIFGGEGDDSILGGDGNDKLHGGGIINPGGSDNDTLNGGAGDDLYQFFREEELVGGDLGSDTIVEATGGANDDFDALDFTNFGEAVTVNIANSTALSMAGDLIVTLTNPEGIEGVIGTAFGDNITGNDRDNVLDGAAEGDSISGGMGDDILIGGLGADTLDGGADDDLLMAGYLDFGEDAISALIDIQTEWSSGNTYATRVNNILTAIPASSQLDPGTTALDDAEVDSLIGGTDDDWFLLDSDEDTDDAVGIEVETEIDV